MQPWVVAVPTLTVEALPSPVTCSTCRSAALTSVQAPEFGPLPGADVTALDGTADDPLEVGDELLVHATRIVANAMIASSEEYRMRQTSRPSAG